MSFARSTIPSASAPTGAPAAEMPAPDPPPAARLVPPRPTVGAMLREFAANRHLLWALATRVVAKTYAKTKVGRGWLVIRPVMDVCGMAFIFGGVLGVSARDGTPYLLFLVVGTASFRLADRMLLWITRCFDRYQKFTRRFDMPLLLLPVAGMAPALLEFAVYVAITLIAALVYLALDGKMWLEFGPQTIQAVAGLALCMALAFGIGLFTAIANAYTRDVRHTMRYVTTLWMFVTPVLYPLSQLPGWLETIAPYNPLAPAITLVRRGVLGSDTAIETAPMISSVLSIAGIVAIGLFFFSRQATNFMGPAGWDRQGRADDDDDDDDDDAGVVY